MPRITAIEPQQKNPGRVNIYLDGDFAFGLARIVAAWLKVGQDLGEEKIAALQGEDAGEIAYQKALHFIDYRPRSAAEVRQNLIRRAVPETLVEQTIARLQQNSLLNDEQFARTWIENRSEFRPRSRSALKMELRRKGLSDEVIQSVVDVNLDEEALARAAARKQAHRYKGLEWPEFRKKLGGFLARRGFSYTIIAPVLSEVWQEMPKAAETGETLNNEE